MNLLQLVQRLHREARRSGAPPTTLVNARIEVLRLADWINDAWQRIQAEPYNWRWMRATADVAWPQGMVIGSAGAGIADFGSWRKASGDYWPRALDPQQPASLWRIDWLDYDEFMRRRDIEPASGWPTRWTIGPGDELMLLPPAIADVTVRVDYQRARTSLLGDTDEPNMPERHHMILVWRAMVEYAKASVAPEDFSRASDNLSDMMSDLIADQGEQMRWASSPLA